MDPENVQAVEMWPTPSSRKEVQRFLGFANFCRKFIRNFSPAAALLHALTSSKFQFFWIHKLKPPFCSLRSVSSQPWFLSCLICLFSLFICVRLAGVQKRETTISHTPVLFSQRNSLPINRITMLGTVSC